MKQQIPIDAITGRMQGEPEPNYEQLAVIAIDMDCRTISAIQQLLKITYNDANKVFEIVQTKESTK